MDDFLKFIKPVSWADVFLSWRDAEAHLPRWIEHYTMRGFNSWEDWRNDTFKDLPYASLEWKLFEVKDPVAHIQHFFGGPFRAWKNKYYDGASARSFMEIIGRKDFEQNEVIMELLANFPAETTLIGLNTPIGIVVIEGMHRACALALAARNKVEIHSKVLLALADYSGTIQELGQADSPT
jgi:hypothetical protein